MTKPHGPHSRPTTEVDRDYWDRQKWAAGFPQDEPEAPAPPARLTAATRTGLATNATELPAGTPVIVDDELARRAAGRPA